MAKQTPFSLPPAAGECLTVTQPAQPGAAAQQAATKLFRSADGKMRVDSGNTSVILDPARQQTIVLDHLKKEARIVPIAPPSAPSVPGLDAVPGGLPGAPQAPAINIQDLGKGLIDGLEVEGKRYTFQPPGVPKPPGVPSPPAIPQPKLPGAPGVPQAPQLPPLATSEVWTSTKLQLPVLTKTTGDFGQQTCRCKYSDAVEPPASLFQIPPEYKPVR